MKKFTRNQLNFQLVFWLAAVTIIAILVLLVFLIIGYYKIYLPDYEKNKTLVETECKIVNVNVDGNAMTVEYIVDSQNVNITGLQIQTVYVDDPEDYVNKTWVQCYYNMCEYKPMYQPYIDLCVNQIDVDIVRFELYKERLAGNVVTIIFILCMIFTILYMICGGYMAYLMCLNETYYIDDAGILRV